LGKQIENDFVLKYVAMIFATCFVYSNLRYVVFGPEDGTHVPLFIMNKALSWSGLATIGLSKVLRQDETSRIAGLLGALMIGMHVVISFIVLRPEYLGKFFSSADGMRMTWKGEVSILAGVLGLACLTCLLWNTATVYKKANQSIRIRSVLPRGVDILLFCATLHVAFMGWDEWFEPTKWADFGYLPPITMLSFLTGVIFLFTSCSSSKT